MRNLITGGSGFVGSHLAEYLLAQGEEVIVLDDLSTGRFDNIRGMVGRQRFAYFIGRAEDRSILDKVIDRVDRIYHLAASVGVQLVVEDPVRTIENNILSTQAVFDVAVTHGKSVLLTSTSEVYGCSNNLPFSEESDVSYGPTSQFRWSYAVSKAVDEFLLLAYHRNKGLPGVVVRLFNTVGPRQTGRYGMVIPRFVKQAMSGESITVYGTGEQKRCFAHVLDIVPALHKLMNCPAAMGKVVNLGNDIEVSISMLAEHIREFVAANVEIIFVPYEKVYGKNFADMMARRPDLTRAKQLIGYQASRPLSTIIKDVYEYYLNCN